MHDLIFLCVFFQLQKPAEKSYISSSSSNKGPGPSECNWSCDMMGKRSNPPISLKSDPKSRSINFAV